MKTGLLGRINAGRGAASFIWMCHLAIAVFFCSTAISYGLKTYYWVAVFVMTASIPYAVAAMEGKFIPYEGHYFFMAGLLVSFTAYFFLPIEKIRLNFESCDYAIKLVTAGTLFFLIAYYSTLGKMIAQTLPLRRFIITRAVIPRLPVKLYFIGWSLRLLPNLTSMGMSILEKAGIFNMPMKLLNKIQGWEINNMLTSYGICAALMIDTYLSFSVPDSRLGTVAVKRAAAARLLTFLSLEICFSFFSGMSGNVIRPFIFISLAYMKTKKTLPIVPLILIAFLFLFYVVPFTKTFREFYWGRIDARSSISYAREKLSDENELSTKRDEVFIRLSNPLEMTTICYEIRKEGRTVSTYNRMDDYFSRFVPRFLWPNKPAVDYNRIGREIGLLNENDFGTSVGLTLIGGLVMDSGASGVIIGMLVIGVLIRILWHWLIVRSQENIFAFVIYCILIYRFIFPEDFYAIIHSIIAFVIYAYFLSAFVNRGYYKSVRVAGQK